MGGAERESQAKHEFEPPRIGIGARAQARSMALRRAIGPAFLPAVFLSAAFGFVAWKAAAQDAMRSEPPPAEMKVRGEHLYPDLPVETLKKMIPELEGLRPAADQQRLSAILTDMAGTIADMVPRLPDIISREEVVRAEAKPGPTPPAWLLGVTRPGSGPSTIAPPNPHSEQYQYLILCHRAANGTTSLEEMRTDVKGRSLDPHKAGAPRGSGFAYQWLLFGAANQAEFEFSLLGEQQFEGRNTFVLAFAQIPGAVKFPAIFQSDGKQAPYLYQGILWVDQATSNIVLLRSDIEAPLKSPRLEQLTTELHFRSVVIRDFEQSFWLPSEVHIEIAQGPLLIEEKHQYSDYHLYHASMRIMPQQ